MKVYILFHETNTGKFDESDGYVEAVYATEEAANAARLATIREAIAKGLDIYYDPDTDTDYPDTWEHDWRVEAHTVLDTVPEILLPYYQGVTPCP